MVGQTIGHYKILDKLGAGGMGEVYRAEDTTLGRAVAIKVLPEAFSEDPERLARFEREAKLLATLNHPHIAQIHSLEEVYGQKLLVMEFVDGETLAERLQRGAMPLEEALPVALQIVQALEAAHERGIVHRDLKPANVKLTPEGLVKVLDFGLAKPVTDAGAGDLSHSPTLTYSPTQAGVLLGTAAYMSPEQARGKEVDRRSDIWAFGVVLWEMVTGRRLFDGDTVSDILAAVLRAEPDWDQVPAQAPRAVRRVLRRCLTRDLTERLHDIADARLDIEEATSTPTPPTSEPRLEQPTPALWQRVRAVWWIVPLALLSGTALSGLVWWMLTGGAASTATQTPAARRAAITLPDGINVERVVTFKRPNLAASPDGRWLIFVAEKEGTYQLFKRSLEHFEVTPIPGSENARHPFFSPDSRWVGFFDLSEFKLKKVALEGGPPIVLSDALNPYGGTWGPDGSIVFNPSDHEGLWRVSGAGGQAEPLLLANPDDGITDYYEPDFLPDGKALLYTAWRGGFTAVSDQVGILDLASGETRVLIENAVAARYLPSGHILFGRGDRVEVAPFDVGARELTGPPVPIPEPVMVDSFLSLPDLAITGDGTLAYLPGLQETRRRLVYVDLLGKEQSIMEARRGFWRPCYSPDGRSLAVSIVESGRSSIWVINPATGAQTRLAGEGEKMFPVWSQDGQRVAFAMTGQDPPASWSIFWQPIHGVDPPEPLLMAREPGETLWPYSWTPDGRTLVFGRVLATATGGANEIWYLSLATDEELQPVPVTAAESDQAVLSPDGHWLAYISYETGRAGLYVQRFPQGTERHQVSVEEAASVIDWSPDGRRLYFIQADLPITVMEVTVSTTPHFQAEAPRKLFEGHFTGGPWTMMAFEDLSPDGKHFVTVKPDETWRLTNEIRVVFNWFEELERLAPTSGS